MCAGLQGGKTTASPTLLLARLPWKGWGPPPLHAGIRLIIDSSGSHQAISPYLAKVCSYCLGSWRGIMVLLAMAVVGEHPDMLYLLEPLYTSHQPVLMLSSLYDDLSFGLLSLYEIKFCF